MEGHASPVKTDPHYIKKEFEEVQEIYLQAIEDLTIENIDSKLLSNKKISELESFGPVKIDYGPDTFASSIY